MVLQDGQAEREAAFASITTSTDSIVVDLLDASVEIIPHLPKSESGGVRHWVVPKWRLGGLNRSMLALMSDLLLPWACHLCPGHESS